MSFPGSGSGDPSPSVRLGEVPSPGRAGAAQVTRRALLAADLLDDLLRDVPGNLGVGVELHGVDGSALRLAAQVADVAEHLRERDDGADDLGAARVLHGLDVAAAGVQVAYDVTHVLLRGPDLHGHDRLEEGRVGAPRGLLERHRTGGL